MIVNSLLSNFKCYRKAYLSQDFPKLADSVSSMFDRYIEANLLTKAEKSFAKMDSIMESKICEEVTSCRKKLISTRRLVRKYSIDAEKTLDLLEKITNVYLIQEASFFSKYTPLEALQNRRKHGLCGLSLYDCQLSAEYAQKSSKICNYLQEKGRIFEEIGRVFSK